MKRASGNLMETVSACRVSKASAARRRASRHAILLSGLMALSGCAQYNDPSLNAVSNTAAAFGSSADTASSYSPVNIAQQNFNNGDFGNAEKNYRAAVEQNPKDADAWLGLAASYDRLRRFDSANKAYSIVIELVGYTAPVLNNLGYHYYLRGEHDKARKAFAAAQRKDPGNPFINNNLELLKNADVTKEPRPEDVTR